MGNIITPGGNGGSGLLVIPGQTEGRITIDYNTQTNQVLLDARGSDIRVVIQVLQLAMAQVIGILFEIASGFIRKEGAADDEKEDNNENGGE